MWNGIVAMALPKQDRKKNCNWFVAISLPKMGRKKKWFPKSGEELKKSVTSTIFLQHFHNKLQVIRIISSNLNLTLILLF